MQRRDEQINSELIKEYKNKRKQFTDTESFKKMQVTLDLIENNNMDVGKDKIPKNRAFSVLGKRGKRYKNPRQEKEQ